MTKTAIRKQITRTLDGLCVDGATEAQLRSVVADISANDAAWARLFPAKAKTRNGQRKAGAR